MLLKKDAELLSMPIVLLSASCRSSLIRARAAPSLRANVVCTVARLTAAMFANRKLGWIEKSKIDGEEFEISRARGNIATKCVHVIRNLACQCRAESVAAKSIHANW
jgi:hypothetical protein